jgi:predicted 3-demethylubiquinone-9 3-methyltransferase (glyoxalase superfamily)
MGIGAAEGPITRRSKPCIRRSTEAISLQVSCETQQEVDRLWGQLTAGGGAASKCGWLKDKYGLSWQIVPAVLIELMGAPDPHKAGRVGQAMMGMGKLDIAALKRAHAGK